VERTNAQVLTDHAKLLLAHGRAKEAEPLLWTLAQARWQPRFTHLARWARGELDRLR
jgi:hypothetical protein